MKFRYRMGEKKRYDRATFEGGLTFTSRAILRFGEVTFRDHLDRVLLEISVGGGLNHPLKLRDADGPMVVMGMTVVVMILVIVEID